MEQARRATGAPSRATIRVPHWFVGDAGAGEVRSLVAPRRRGRALDLYFLALAAAAGSPEVPTVPAAVWGRAGMSPAGAEPTILSRLWRWLASEGLIEAGMTGRQKRIRLEGTPPERDDLILATAFFFGDPQITYDAREGFIAGGNGEGVELRLSDDEAEMCVPDWAAIPCVGASTHFEPSDYCEPSSCAYLAPLTTRGLRLEEPMSCYHLWPTRKGTQPPPSSREARS